VSRYSEYLLKNNQIIKNTLMLSKVHPFPEILYKIVALTRIADMHIFGVFLYRPLLCAQGFLLVMYQRVYIVIKTYP